MEAMSDVDNSPRGTAWRRLQESADAGRDGEALAWAVAFGAIRIARAIERANESAELGEETPASRRWWGGS
jgi:hypothetical protein